MNTNFHVATRLALILIFLWLFGCSQQEDSKSAQPMTEPATSSPEVTSSPGDSDAPADTPPAESSSTVSESSDTATAVVDTPAATSDPMNDSDKTAAPAAAPQQDAGDHTDQLALARKSGCLACHGVDKKLVGPAWRDVSKRYKDDPDAKTKLITKVSKGGRGNWTEVVGTAAMPPYSPRVSDDNIAKLVEFVLSLEK